MKEEINIKKVWEKPSIIALDIKQTKGGTDPEGYEDYGEGPLS